MSKVLEAIDAFAASVNGKKVSTDAYAELQTMIEEAKAKLENIGWKSGDDYLLLKWGGWKSWNSENKKIQELMKKHDALGLSASAMLQHETEEQQKILCEIVDLIDGVIQNDWDGEYYTKKKAKEYIMGYG